MPLLHRYALTVALAFGLLAGLSGTARAAEKMVGTSCSGDANNADWDTIAECSSGTFARGPYFFGSSSITCDNSQKGLTAYNTTTDRLAFCNGTAWMDAAAPPAAPVISSPASSGYFVLSAGTWAGGSLGNLSGADALCLTDLTTNTSWKGYSTANGNGWLTADHVHAWLCNGLNCMGLMPLTTYKFARADSSSAGGNTFTTNSYGYGPGDNADWSGANYFSGTYNYQTGQALSSGSSSLADASNGYNFDCVYWSYTGGGYSGWGASNTTDSGRWYAGGYGDYQCGTAMHLICFVNP